MMAKQLEAALNPQLSLAGLLAPVAGTPTSAAEIEAALQQLLDNDAWLTDNLGQGGGMMPSEATWFRATVEDITAEGDKVARWLNVPSVGLILAATAPAGRLLITKDGGSDTAGRGLYTAPAPGLRPVLEVGLGRYGGTIILERPLSYGIEKSYPGADSRLKLHFTAWDDFAYNFNLGLLILPLGNWVSESQDT